MSEHRWTNVRLVKFTAIVGVCMICLGCDNRAKEQEAVSQLKQLGALVVPDVNKRASSFVLPSDPEKIKQALPLIPELRYLASFGAVNTPMTDEGMPFVAKLKNLTNVDVSGTQVTNAGVRHLVGMTKLASLNLADTQITSECLSDIGKLPTISMLNLAGTKLSGGFEHLAGCEELTWLVLSNIELTDADAAALATHPNLQRLSISDGVAISEDSKALLISKGMQVDHAATSAGQDEAVDAQN